MHPDVAPDEYLALRASVDWPEMSPDVAASALRSSIAITAARDRDGKLVALARAVGDGFYVVIVDVMVTPAEQENGMGHRILESLLDDPRVCDAGHLALFAAPDAVDLYESFGFREENGVYMRRP